MPFQVPKRRITDTENRLRVLDCLDALGMATLEQLWPFIARLELMEYVPLCVYVDELLRDGSLAEGVHGLKGMLYLTAEGRQSLALFADKMPSADRERIRKAAPVYSAQLSERRQIRAVHERAPKGENRLLCTVREGDVPTLLLRIRTPSRALAESAIKRFRLCAARLLMLLYTLPAPDGETPSKPPENAGTLEAAMASAAPGQWALCAYGRHEHSAVVCFQGQDALYTAALLMPGRESAEAWARAALSREAYVAGRLTALLMGRDEANGV